MRFESLENRHLLSVSVNDVQVTEGTVGTVNAVFTVTLSPASGQAVTVEFATGDSTAAAPSDYLSTSGTLSFAAGNTTQTLTVAVNGDTSFEGNETFTVNLSNATGNTSIATPTGTGTILNDDAAPTLSIGNLTLAEGNGGTTNFIFTVTQSAVAGGNTTVVFNTGNGTATAVSDFTPTAGTLTIAAGNTTGTITVAVLGDTTPEPNETFTVNLSGAGNATIATATGTGTIVNDDGATLSIGNLTLAEGNSGTTNYIFTVTQSVVAGGNTTVIFSTGNGTATAGSDFTPTAGTLTIAAGNTTGTITVAVLGDTTLEPNETFTVNLTSAGNATIATATGTGTIVNDDGATLSIGNLTLAEGNGGATNYIFTVTQSAAASGNTTVIFNTGNGTATAGSDFIPTAGTLTIAAGNTTGTITVAVLGDTTPEPNETFTVDLTSAGNATIAAATGTGMIVNDDGPTLSIGNLTLAEGNSGTTNFIFTVTQSVVAGGNTTIVFNTGNGTATAGSDFIPTAGTLTIAAGNTTGTITVAVLGDTTPEPDETFTVNLSSAGNATITTATGTGTIVNDDGPTLSIGNLTLAEGNGGTTNFIFTVTQSAAASGNTTVVFNTGNGTATAGSDFTPTAGTLTIAAGNTTGTITVAVLGDTTSEPDETFTINLSSAGNATIATATGTGTIVNDDGMPTLSIGNLTLAEGNSGTTNYIFTVTQSAAAGGNTTVVFNTGNGTATAGSDFTPTAGTLTIATGNTTGTITVAVLGDTTPEPNETFTVNLSSAGNATIATATGTGTIVNDDGPTLSIGNLTLAEGNGGATNYVFTVTQSAPASGNTTVIFNTGNGTATAGSDFTPTAGTLTIAAGNTTGTITVAVLGDTTPEPDETFTVNLSSAGNATIATATGTGTIVNDDGMPTLSIGNVTQSEGNSGITNFVFTVTQSAVAAGNTTVFFNPGNGTATAGSDFTPTAGILTIAAGSTTGTITVAVLGDTTSEPDETFTINLSSAGNATIATATGTGTIVNDDGTPTLSIGNLTLAEGNGGATNYIFTVTQSAAASGNTTVIFNTGNGTATAGSDFTPTAGTLTIAAGNTTGTITVAVLGDTTPEPDETFTVNLSSAGNATIATATGTGTIVNDDATTPTLSIGNVTQSEGNSGITNFVFTVTQSAVAAGNTTVFFNPGNGTATAGTDFTPTAGILTIAAGSTTGTITVAVLGDTTSEPNETFTINLSSAGNATIATATGTGTIVNDDGTPTLSIGNLTLAEGNSGATNYIFTVTQSAVASGNTTVIFNTGNGTATAGNDFTPTAGTLTIAAGNTTGTITVAVLGDTTLEPNETFTVNLSSAGNATIATATGTGTIVNDDGNVPPIADAGGPYSVAEGGAVGLSGTASDPNDTFTLVWDLDGDGAFGETGSTATRGNETGASPTFNAVGLSGPTTRTVTLRATDTAGASTTATSLVTVNNVAPVADAGGPYQVAPGGTVTLTGTGTDPVDTVTLAWDLDGDGTFGETGTAASRGNETGASPTFNAAGLNSSTTRTVTLRVTDFDGTSSTDTATVTVLGASTGVELIIDDGNAGFSQNGFWITIPIFGFKNDFRINLPGSGRDHATWTFSGLDDGTYEVFANWRPFPLWATNSPFSIFDATSLEATAIINQRRAPDDVVAQGVAWERLATVSIVSGTLRVELTDQANGVVVADAVRIVKVEDSPLASTGQSAPLSDSISQKTLAAELPDEVFDVLDVSRDGHVSGMDALLLVEALNTSSSSSVSQVPGNPRLDTNGDGHVTGIDLLRVLERLNSHLEVPVPQATPAANTSDFGDLSMISQGLAANGTNASPTSVALFATPPPATSDLDSAFIAEDEPTMPPSELLDEISRRSLSTSKSASVEAALVDQVLTDASFDWAQALD